MTSAVIHHVCERAELHVTVCVPQEDTAAQRTALGQDILWTLRQLYDGKTV